MYLFYVVLFVVFWFIATLGYQMMSLFYGWIKFKLMDIRREYK